MSSPEVSPTTRSRLLREASLTAASISTLGKTSPPSQQTTTPIVYQGGFYVHDRLVEYRAKGVQRTS